MISIDSFGQTAQGEELFRYTLKSQSIRVSLTNFGATLLTVETPDKDGKLADIVLGFDTLAPYFDNPACYGATIGPSANRTDKGELFIEGTRYQLPQNDGPDLQNNLHTDLACGLHKCVWEADLDDKNNAVIFSYHATDGQWGLPGERHVSVRYTVEDDCLRIEQRATTDAPTFVNMTNHSYFNLGGIGSGHCLDTLVKINAHNYLPVRDDSVSEGSIEPVTDTPFDFLQAKPLGQDINQDNIQLKRARGYDHCMIVDGYSSDAAPREALIAHDPRSGRSLTISITAPAAHLYTGNWLSDANAKAGISFGPRDGFAFEPEFMPDCAHHDDWPQPVCTPEHPWSQTIVYQFGTL